MTSKISKILDSYNIDHSYNHFLGLEQNLFAAIKEICELQKEECARAASVIDGVQVVDRNSILNCKNICDEQEEIKKEIC